MEFLELITQLNTPSLRYEIDKFSDLPEAILHHVFSFLDSNDIVQLWYVSRNFRKMCITSPNLFFKLTFDHEECTPDCKQLQRFLQYFLNQHDVSKMDRFRLHWFCLSNRYGGEGSIFGRWVQKALEKEVKELDIGISVRTDEMFSFPARSIKSLKLLKLKLQEGNIANLLASELPSLEALSLTSASIPSIGFGEWVSNSCKSLQVLNLRRVADMEYLNINSSSLRVLTFEHIIWLKSYYCNCLISCSSLENLAITKCNFDVLHLTVNAPSLKSLQISDGEIYDHCVLRISAEQLQTLTLTTELSFFYHYSNICRIFSDNFLSLREATLNLVPRPKGSICISKDFVIHGLLKLIDGVRYAKSLQLNFYMIKTLFLWDQLPKITWEHLENLDITVFKLRLDVIRAIAAFLVPIRTLKTFTLRYVKNRPELCDETKIWNQLRSEVEKFGADCGTTKFVYVSLNTKRKREA